MRLAARVRTGVGDRVFQEQQQARRLAPVRFVDEHGPLSERGPIAGADETDDRVKERLSLQGNPAVKDDWYVNPKTKEEVTFIDFARSEGRFSKHFDKDGNPSPTLVWANEERLENWHLLQELAGLR